MRTRKGLACTISAVILLIAFLVSAHAQVPSTTQPPQIRLRYSTHNAATHPYTKADYAWADWVYKKTNGRVKIDVYPGGTLIGWKESYVELAKGVADVGYVVAEYNPYADLARDYLSFFYALPDSKKARLVYKEIWANFPEVREEWPGVKVCFAWGWSPYHLISRKPIRTISDFKGLQIKALAFAQPLIKGLGAEPVAMPMGEVFISLQKGILDGALVPWETLKTFRFAEVTKYATELNLGQGVQPNRAFNLNSWNKLPPDIQKILEESFPVWESYIDQNEEESTKAGYDFGKANGVQFFKLSSQDQAKVYEIAGMAAAQLAREADGRGHPGTKILKEAQRLTKKYGQ